MRLNSDIFKSNICALSLTLLQSTCFEINICEFLSLTLLKPTYVGLKCDTFEVNLCVSMCLEFDSLLLLEPVLVHLEIDTVNINICGFEV